MNRFNSNMCGFFRGMGASPMLPGTKMQGRDAHATEDLHGPKVWMIVVALVAMLPAIGCHSNRSSRAGERTVIVQSATQPGDGERPYDTPRKIRVIVDDTAAGGASHATTVDALVGKKCRVQFRRDALGLISDSPTPPLGEGLFKRPVFLDGTLTKSGSDGVLLGTESGMVWIPWTSVLLIEARD